MKLCKDCKYFVPVGKNIAHTNLCDHPDSFVAIDPIYGDKGVSQAQTMRLDDTRCGHSGKLFEPVVAETSRYRWWQGWFAKEATRGPG